jgi:hypothetical protein
MRRLVGLARSDDRQTAGRWRSFPVRPRRSSARTDAHHPCRNASMACQVLVPFVVAGYDDQIDTPGARLFLKPLQPVAPVFNTAKNAQDYDPGSANRLLRIKINRIGMRQAPSGSQDAGPGHLDPRPLRRCQAAKLGIGGGQKQDVGRLTGRGRPHRRHRRSGASGLRECASGWFLVIMSSHGRSMRSVAVFQ